MSAIAGALHFDTTPVDRALLERLSTFAPGNIGDALGFWQAGNVGLGHAMFRVTGEAYHETQPLSDPLSGCVVVFDGRIDNRAELLSQLAGCARLTDQQSDAAYALAGYLKWGTEVSCYLLGDFAFAIWNPQTQQLFLTRDPVGIRPLYYSPWGKRFTFASTLEQLLNDPALPRDIEEETVLRFLYADPPKTTQYRTYYRQVRILPGGHSLLVEQGQIRVWRYYDWLPQPPEHWTASQRAIEEFRAVFTDAVRCRLHSISPVGVLLSGGLDSGAIACVAGYLAEREGASPINAYSAVFDQFSSCDERAYSRAASSRYGFRHTCLPCDDCGSLSQLEQWLPVFTEPYFAPYDGNLYKLLTHARKDNLRVMMYGDGGDLALNGSPAYLGDWLLQGRWLHVHRQAQTRAHNLNKPYWRCLAGGLLTLLPVRIQHAIENYRGPRVKSWLPKHLSGRFEMNRPSYMHAGRNAWWYSMREGISQLGDGMYNAYKDRLMRLFGLELREPFYDLRLLNLVLRVPPDTLNRDGKTKVLLRESLHDILPPLIRDRTDKGQLSPLMHNGLRERRRHFVEALLEHSELERREYVEPESWKQAINDYLNYGGPPLNSYWRSLTMEMWLRHQVGRLPAPD